MPLFQQNYTPAKGLSKFTLLGLVAVMFFASLSKGQMFTARQTQNQSAGASTAFHVNKGLFLAQVSAARNTSFPTEYFFELENLSSTDNGPDENSDNDNVTSDCRTTLDPLCKADQRRTTAILAHCAAIYHLRSCIPLFVLHHAWQIAQV